MSIRHILFATLALSLLGLCASQPAAAGTVMVYEGLLQEKDGSMVAYGWYTFDFALFRAPSDGTAVWKESHQDVVVDKGRYAVTLGNVVPLDLPEGEYFLEITVNGEVLSPRTKTMLAQGNCTVDGNLFVLNGNLGVGTTSPSQLLEINGNNAMAGLRIAYGSTYPALFGELKRGAGEGLILNSNASGGWADIHFQTEGVTKMFIERVGNVGINTTAPSAKLEVNGDAKVGDFSSPPTGAGALLHVFNPTGVGNSLRVSSYIFGTEDMLVVTGTGNVGLGVASPTHRIQLSGGAYSDGGAWVDGSSRTLKQEITNLGVEEAMSVLSGLQPVTFRYNAQPAERNAGFIAEDVPELVATADRKGLAPLEIVAVLTKVVQLQQEQIQNLQAQVAALAGPAPAAQ